MGNTIVLQLSLSGVLVHMLTATALARALPPGVVNFVSDSSGKAIESIMRSGLVDCLGFSGNAKVLDQLIVQHPQPRRLKVFSQISGKNIAVVLPDANLQVAASEIVLGSLA